MNEGRLGDMLEKIDALLQEPFGVPGLVLENMTRTQAWQFLHLGRRLERGLQTSGLIRIMLHGRGAARASRCSKRCSKWRTAS